MKEEPPRDWICLRMKDRGTINRKEVMCFVEERKLHGSGK